MEALTRIPFAFDAPKLMKLLHIDPASSDAAEFESLLAKARSVGAPKAIYRDCFISAKSDSSVTLEGVTFLSHTLRKNLDKAERVFAFVCTCGGEMDRVAPASDNFLACFWWDAIKSDMLFASRQFLVDHLARRFRLGKSASMSPGSGDVDTWPIEEQRKLFSLLGDVTALIGVRLTDSYLMVPNKTISGLRFPTETDFRTCQVCHRIPCPSRSAPFDKALWESLQHD